MNFWIFQDNPDVFDINTYLHENEEVVWSVRQEHLAAEMETGDEVFLWRAGGKKRTVAGIVGIARIINKPEMMPDYAAAQLSGKKTDYSQQELRVKLRLEKRYIGDGEIIKHNWIKEDPALKDLPILRIKTRTNYRITASEAHRLANLCRTKGTSWNYEETLAALWAFQQAALSEYSTNSESSPIAVVALLTGRSVSDVKNKVNAFQQIQDKKDSGQEPDNIESIENEVWGRFMNQKTGKINTIALSIEFKKLWQNDTLTTLYRPHYGDFGEAPDDDPAELKTFAARVRKGQPRFRNKLLELYGFQCAISGFGPPEVLEAAHIYPHAKSGVNKSVNGILLRADFHYLMDSGLLHIHPDTFEVHLNERLRNSSYWEYNGKKLRPRNDGSHPDRDYLRRQWEEMAR